MLPSMHSAVKLPSSTLGPIGYSHVVQFLEIAIANPRKVTGNSVEEVFF